VLREDDIAEAATAIAREQGSARLSMRAVARHLGVPTMTIYGYVPNKDALDALVIDRILRDVRVPDPSEGQWEVRLHHMLCDARRVLVDRPHLGEGQSSTRSSAVELVHRGTFGSEALRLASGVIDLLTEGGFAPEDLDVCFGALFTYVTGYVDPADADTRPRRLAGRVGGSRNQAEIFASGLEALIEGLKVTRSAPHGYRRAVEVDHSPAAVARVAPASAQRTR
jgi:AcrR family transcriptional regulator